ncbi:DMT family transporter [Desulfothermobacter acidiphilus]|uniref:DMT family transporter n=1 Tax=Desulfothermobacter acidiphilus TaxID=1938353 RepID=UPI003F8875CD
MKGQDALQLLLVTLLWGLTFPLAKIGSNFLPPLFFAASRFLLGALCLYIWWAWSRKKWWHSRSYLRSLILLGLLQTAAMGVALHFGISLVPSSLAVIVLYSYPLFFTMFAYLFLKEPLALNQFLGLVLGFSGLALAIDPWQAAFHAELLGVLVLLGGAMAWGLASVYFKAVFAKADKLEITTFQMLYGAVLLVPWAWLDRSHLLLTPAALGVLLYTGILTSAVGFAVLLSLQARYPASCTGVFLFLVPVFGALFGYLFLGEALTWNLGLGLILIAGGVVAVNWRPFSLRLWTQEKNSSGPGGVSQS